MARLAMIDDAAEAIEVIRQSISRLCMADLGVTPLQFMRQAA